MAEGTVISFDPELGYGSIKADGGGPELYVHYSEIQMSGYKVLNAGQRVSFFIEQGDSGPQAVTVSAMSGPW